MHYVLLSTVLGLLSCAAALVEIAWNIPDTPSEGLTRIIFNIYVDKIPDEAGYTFGHKFTFTNSDIEGYIGLETRPKDAHGFSRIRAVFNTNSADGVRSTHEGCKNTGGSMTCAFDFNGYPGGYTLSVNQVDDGSTWLGDLYDPYRGFGLPIGSWTVLSSGGIRPEGRGVVLLADGTERVTCNSLLDASVVFENPRITHTDVGAFKEPHKDGECAQGASLGWMKVEDGYAVFIGK